MRDVNVVKAMRNKLRDEMIEFMDARNEKYPTLSEAHKLGEFERKELNYMISTIHSLRIQINALEFVLNEDTSLNDMAEPKLHEIQYGIQKSKALQRNIFN